MPVFNPASFSRGQFTHLSFNGLLRRVKELLVFLRTTTQQVVWVVQRFGVGLVIERS